MAGRRSKYGGKKYGKMAYFTQEEYEMINALGIDFSTITREMWLGYLGSDDLGIDQLETDIDKERAQLASKELALREKRRIKEIMEAQQIREKVESFVPAYWLRFFLANEARTAFKKWAIMQRYDDVNLDNFSISQLDLRKIKADMESGLLLPDAPLEKWAEYNLRIKNGKMKQDARVALVKELSVSVNLTLAEKKDNLEENYK